VDLKRARYGTVAVGSEVARPEPVAFVAVTIRRMRFPRSASATTYVPEVAPGMSAHAPVWPELTSHRCHWNAKPVGLPLQTPVDPVKVWPTWAVPVMVGGEFGTGAPAGWTTPVAADVALALPPALVAVTRTRMVAPRSASVSTYDAPVAPAASVQVAPDGSHRCHW
jgi:hypothetical protein